MDLELKGSLQKGSKEKFKPASIFMSLYALLLPLQSIKKRPIENIPFIFPKVHVRKGLKYKTKPVPLNRKKLAFFSEQGALSLESLDRLDNATRRYMHTQYINVCGHIFMQGGA